MRSRFAFRLIPLALAAALACQKPQPAPPTVRLGYAAHDHHSPLYVAALGAEALRAGRQPYLREVKPRLAYDLIRGDRVVAHLLLSASPGGKEISRRLAEDQLDAAFGGFPAFVQQIDQGGALKIVAPVMAGGSGLLVRPDFPAKGWDDFVAAARATRKPIRVGYRAEAAVQKLLFEDALRLAGVRFAGEMDAPEAEVVLVNLYGEGSMISALEARLVDGLLGVQPQLALAEEKGLGRVLSSLEDLPGALCGERCEGGGCLIPCCAFAARTDFLQRSPGAAEALVALVLAANRVIARNPDGAAVWTSAWLGTPLAAEQRSLRSIHFFTARDAVWDEGVRRWVERMAKGGTLKGSVARSEREGNLEGVLYDTAAYERGKGSL